MKSLNNPEEENVELWNSNMKCDLVLGWMYLVKQSPLWGREHVLRTENIDWGGGNISGRRSQAKPIYHSLCTFSFSTFTSPKIT